MRKADAVLLDSLLGHGVGVQGTDAAGEDLDEISVKVCEGAAVQRVAPGTSACSAADAHGDRASPWKYVGLPRNRQRWAVPSAAIRTGKRRPDRPAERGAFQSTFRFHSK